MGPDLNVEAEPLTAVFTSNEFQTLRTRHLRMRLGHVTLQRALALQLGAANLALQPEVVRVFLDHVVVATLLVFEDPWAVLAAQVPILTNILRPVLVSDVTLDGPGKNKNFIMDNNFFTFVAQTKHFASVIPLHGFPC